MSIKLEQAAEALANKCATSVCSAEDLSALKVLTESITTIKTAEELSGTDVLALALSGVFVLFLVFIFLSYIRHMNEEQLGTASAFLLGVGMLLFFFLIALF